VGGTAVLLVASMCLLFRESQHAVQHAPLSLCMKPYIAILVCTIVSKAGC
jgi:hypothetical protein